MPFLWGSSVPCDIWLQSLSQSLPHSSNQLDSQLQHYKQKTQKSSIVFPWIIPGSWIIPYKKSFPSRKVHKKVHCLMHHIPPTTEFPGLGEGLRRSLATLDPFVLTNKICLNQFPGIGHTLNNLISPRHTTMQATWVTQTQYSSHRYSSLLGTQASMEWEVCPAPCIWPAVVIKP